jgi:hypothetical protein
MAKVTNPIVRAILKADGFDPDDMPDPPQTETPPRKYRPNEICRCERCHTFFRDADKRLCVFCQREKDEGYKLRRKLGRLANGAEADSGQLLHILPTEEYERPLCGAKPGKRSIGWALAYDREKQKICARCAERYKRLTGKNPEYLR